MNRLRAALAVRGSLVVMVPLPSVPTSGGNGPRAGLRGGKHLAVVMPSVAVTVTVNNPVMAVPETVAELLTASFHPWQ